MTYTKKNRSSLPWAGWSKIAPKGKQRTRMYKKCGKKCFLGRSTKGDKQHPDFPICKKGTCKVSTKGLAAAYVRAKEWGNKRSTYKSSKPSHKRSYYTKIANKSRKMLKKRGIDIN
jgi:hypothetical protein